MEFNDFIDASYEIHQALIYMLFARILQLLFVYLREWMKGSRALPFRILSINLGRPSPELHRSLRLFRNMKPACSTMFAKDFATLICCCRVLAN